MKRDSKAATLPPQTKLAKAAKALKTLPAASVEPTASALGDKGYNDLHEHLEAFGTEHKQTIIDALIKNGYKPQLIGVSL